MSTVRRRHKPINTSGQCEDIPMGTVSPAPARKIRKCQLAKLEDSHPRFGPFYRQDEPAVNGKEQAWDKVLENSQDRSKTTEDYLEAMRGIEEKAMAIYADEDLASLDDLTKPKFRWLMIKDGCFFLQLALFILGVPSKTLGYDSNSMIFGQKKSEDNINKWIQAMFFAGNQLPLVVLNELMEQSYFQSMLKHVDKGIPTDLPRRILYESLVLPARKENQTMTSPTPRCSDLLHALHSLMFGSGGNVRNVNPAEDETENVDLEAGRGAKRAKDFTFSATELQKKGIRFGKAKEGSCSNNISFENYCIFPRLYLPVFTVDENTELVFKSLKLYEVTQGKHECEVRSYLHLMSDLICTYEDVKLLADKGIIHAEDLYFKEKLLKILGNLAGQGRITTAGHHILRIRLKDYNLAPWEKFKLAAALIFIFTAVQTFFAVLGYAKPRH